MSWNYRVIKRTWTYCESYSIHEAYYTDEKVDGITENPSYPQGDSLEELKEDLERYQKALDKPVLNWEDFECTSAENAGTTTE